MLGGNFDVLSTEIFFAIVGAQHDQGRAAMLAIILLALHAGRVLGAAALARAPQLHDASPARATPGIPLRLPGLVRGLCYATALPWAALTALIYVAIIFGGLVESWGRDHTPTLRHYIHAFGVTAGEHGLVWSGTAWNSFWITLQISAVAAVPTDRDRAC